MLAAHLAGCRPALSAGGPGGPPPVSVAPVTQRNLQASDDFSARLEAAQTVEIKVPTLAALLALSVVLVVRPGASRPLPQAQLGGPPGPERGSRGRSAGAERLRVQPRRIAFVDLDRQSSAPGPSGRSVCAHRRGPGHVRQGRARCPGRHRRHAGPVQPNAVADRQLVHRRDGGQPRAAQIARARFAVGASDFFAVLDAERESLGAQDRLAVAQTQAATSLVGVYRALAGGWGS